jgi:uncharacterized protein (DUF427 family)
MIGPAPLGPQPAGVYNRPPVEGEGLLYLESSPRRIRGLAGGETVVDSRQPRMLHEQGKLPIYLFPRTDVRTDLLHPSKRRTQSANKGEARWWDLELDSGRVEAAAWEYSAPPPDAPPLDGLFGFRWEALEEWFEEDERAIVHPRDPYHRVDVLDTSRRVRISLEGQILADSTRARVIFETNLPPRWYLPREDVKAELQESELRTGCAYKGYASYYSLPAGDAGRDIAWIYENPRREVAPVAGMVCFFNERVDIELDGEPQERPLTPWSPDWPGAKEVDEGPPVVVG